MPKTKLKILKNFKISPDLASRLKKESKRTGRTQTKIVEMALIEMLSKKAA